MILFSLQEYDTAITLLYVAILRPQNLTINIHELLLFEKYFVESYSQL